MTQTSLPAARASFVESDGRPTPQFYRFLETLATAQTGNASSADIAAINTQLAALQAEIEALPESSSYPKLQVTYPILSQGLLQNGFAKLAMGQPGDSGTGSLLAFVKDAWGRITGTKAATITGTAGRVTVANGDASAGLPTIDLATVADTGGGSLLRFVRDAWGRITGTSTPSTTDLAEGSNLYFTAARVLAAVLAGLSTATNAAITAADSVLVAFGKLQAQISANVTAIAGKLAKSANLSDVANGATAFNNLRATFSNIYVSNNVNQNIVTLGTWQKISFNVVSNDTQAEYSTSTNEITVKSTGTYLVFGYGHVEQLTNGAYVAVSAYVNGAEGARLGEQIFAASSGGIGMGGCVSLNLTAGNTVSLWIRVTAGSSPYIDGVPSVCNLGVLRIQ